MGLPQFYFRPERCWIIESLDGFLDIVCQWKAKYTKTDVRCSQTWRLCRKQIFTKIISKLSSVYAPKTSDEFPRDHISGVKNIAFDSKE